MYTRHRLDYCVILHYIISLIVISYACTVQVDDVAHVTGTGTNSRYRSSSAFPSVVSTEYKFLQV